MNIPIYKTSIKIIPIIINAANILALGLSCIHTVYHARDGLPKQLLLKNKQYFYKNTPFFHLTQISPNFSFILVIPL